MVRAFSTEARRSETLRAIAKRLWIDPGASIADLAHAAGLSRRTLYRIAATRNELVRLLHGEAVQSTRRAMIDADIEHGPWREALGHLVERFVIDGPIYAFWVVGAENDPEFDAEMQHYRSSMIDFFKRAQASGGLSEDYPPSWILEVFDGLLLATLSARKHGEVPPENLPRLVLDALIRTFGRTPGVPA